MQTLIGVYCGKSLWGYGYRFKGLNGKGYTIVVTCIIAYYCLFILMYLNVQKD